MNGIGRDSPDPVEELRGYKFAILKLDMLFRKWQVLWREPVAMAWNEKSGFMVGQLWAKNVIIRGMDLLDVADQLPNHMFKKEHGTGIEGLPPCNCRICSEQEETIQLRESPTEATERMDG